MMNTILLIIGLILCTAGVIFIYDARDIAKKVFGFGDQNEATSGLKILGFIMAFNKTVKKRRKNNCNNNSFNGISGNFSSNINI